MYEDITVRQYMNAMWKGDISVMNEDELKLCNTEYIDTAGLYESEEFTKECYIQFLTTRINFIAIGVKLHRQFLNEFGFPFVEKFDIFEKYGHFLLWENNKEKFLKKLTMIQKMEKVYISQLEIKIKELEELKKLKTSDKPIKLTRGGFIRNINTLNKIGYKIDNDKTMMEELAYMVKQQFEENKSK